MAQGQLPEGATIDSSPVATTSTDQTPQSGLPAGATVDAQPMTGQHPASKSIGQRLSDFGEKFVDTMPGIGLVHQVSGMAEDAANKELQKPSVFTSPIKTAAFGVGKDVAGLLHGATSAEGLGVTGATIAAPEVMGPALMAHGGYSMVSGWGDLHDPDVLQRELMGASEVAGGAAAATEGVQGIRQHFANKTSTNAPVQQFEDFKNAVPPSKVTPYTEADYAAARPYMDFASAHGNPVTDIETARNAADAAITRIENRIDNAVKANPQITLNGVDVLSNAKAALKGNVKLSFLKEGMKELEDYPLGWSRRDVVSGQVKTDPPLTLEQADNIRHQLNAENKALMKKNDYDRATAYATDPGFAAREAAAEALRTMIYDTLDKKLGFTDARQLRLDEGSLIKVRNALQDKIYQSEKTVRTNEKVGPIRKTVKRMLPLAGGATGLAGGTALGHPLMGAGMGTEAGVIAAEHIVPPALTRDELIQRSFTPNTNATPRARISPRAEAVAATSAASSQQPNRVFYRASDGSVHSVPADQIDAAMQIDPQLEILQ